MKDSMFFTILAGVSVFVLGQFFLKLVLEPIVEFKKSIGELSAFFLREQSKITNAHCTVDIENELKRLASTLLSTKQAIPFYSLFAMLRYLPSTEGLHKACGSLNLISYYVMPNNPDLESKPNTCFKIKDEMSNIAKNLKVKITYSEL
ncbi:hypothetical protein V6257_12120 [Pseudoalteromonas issachenkonii]|uniref:Uncharacterized protein n=1 Tax=Pseudoalteromonas issachenkonii TaxID=152297 RepID=A0ABU9H1W7_9GAMM